MPPRGSEGSVAETGDDRHSTRNHSLDFSHIVNHYIFLFSTILAVIAWFIAFIAQAISTARFGNGSVGTLWFAIFLQLFVILGVVYTLATDSIAMNRFQISVFGAVALVFAVGGVNQGVFSGFGSLNAMGAGWLILAMVDIIWVLYFTSEEDSLMLHIFNSMGNGGLSPPSRRRRNTRAQSVHNMASPGGYAANYASGAGISSHNAGQDVPYDNKMTMGSPVGGGQMGARSQNSFLGSDANATRSIAGQSIHNGPAGNSQVGLDGGAGSPLMGGAAGIGAGGTSGTSTTTATGEAAPESYSYKAKALYAYTASADDPNEISFAKNEILDIVDKQGKWWQAKKADGSIGIAPSNYLSII